MDGIFNKPEFIWLMAGLLFIVLEFAVPGFIIFFFGVGAIITAIALMVFDMGINAQLLTFIAGSAFSLLLFRRMLKKKFFNAKEKAEKDFEDEYLGKTAIAISKIHPEKKGKVEIFGTTWAAISEFDIKKDDEVIIIKKEGLKLTVVPKNIESD